MKLYFAIRRSDDKIIGYNTDKKIMKLFIYYRGVDEFKIKKKSIDKSEYENIQKNISKLEVLFLKFPTKVLSDEIEMISFPITKKELALYSNMQIELTYEIGKYLDNNPFIFKEKFVQTLFKMAYVQKYVTHNAFIPRFDFIVLFSKYLQDDMEN